MAGPDVLGGKARQVAALVARGARGWIRGATLGLEPPPRAIDIGGCPSLARDSLGRRPAAAGKW